MHLAPTVGAIAISLVSAWVLYSESTTTRRLEQQVQSADRQRERLEEDIAVLRAERAYLARPARIEPAARAIGMRPAKERQYIGIDELAEHMATEPAELDPNPLPASIPVPASKASTRGR